LAEFWLFREQESQNLEVKKMKCRICGKEIGNTETECARCDKFRGDALIDLKAELGI
jgi:hypothetical protein